MRTTIDLPDELVRAAKVRAASQDETLKELFTRALTRELAPDARRERRTLPVIASRRPGHSTLTPEALEVVLNDDDLERAV